MDCYERATLAAIQRIKKAPTSADAISEAHRHALWIIENHTKALLTFTYEDNTESKPDPRHLLHLNTLYGELEQNLIDRKKGEQLCLKS